MRPVLKNALLAALAAVLVLVPTALALLLRDPGQVCEEAVAEAKSELGRHALLHPDEELRTLAVVDYSKPSFMKRMAVIDLRSGRRWYCRVAHGRNSGELLARSFSNVPESNMSSLGLFRVGNAYSGDHGLALRLDGLDSLRNGNAAPRDIVVHSADYVSIPYILWNLATLEGPRIGRSNGCFVVSRGDIGPVAERLGHGGFIYSWNGNPEPR
ncbi:MAG: murein L,D-transpeptidase catalytic domain family protein [Chlorobiaceae bacterium]|nr:murein L,D-transpeptidase catalytic domain family protein [Chlorobiaceae bacterium]